MSLKNARLPIQDLLQASANRVPTTATVYHINAIQLVDEVDLGKLSKYKGTKHSSLLLIYTRNFGCTIYDGLTNQNVIPTSFWRSSHYIAITCAKSWHVKHERKSLPNHNLQYNGSVI